MRAKEESKIAVSLLISLAIILLVGVSFIGNVFVSPDVVSFEWNESWNVSESFVRVSLNEELYDFDSVVVESLVNVDLGLIEFNSTGTGYVDLVVSEEVVDSISFEVSEEEVYVPVNETEEVVVDIPDEVNESLPVEEVVNESEEIILDIGEEIIEVMDESTVPTHTGPYITSNLGDNYSLENLTIYNVTTADGDGDNVKNIYNWYRNGTSIAVLNMPMEGESANLSNAKDYSGYGNNGTNYSAVWVSDGGYDGLGAFNLSSGGAIVVPFNESLQPKDEITMMAWVKLYSFPNGYASILQYPYNCGSHSDPYFEYAIYIQDTGRLHTRIDGSGTDHYGSGLGDGNWQHVAITWDGDDGDIYFYINGTNVGMSDGSQSEIVYQNDCQVIIGENADGTEVTDGLVDDVMIFNISLSAEQIRAHYENKTNFIHNSTTQVGELWNASVTPNDGFIDGETLFASWGLEVLDGTPNFSPTQGTPILNSTTVNNYSYENLTVYNVSTVDQNGDNIKNIYNWYRNGTSIAVLNVPFEGGSNDSLFFRDYSSRGNNVTINSIIPNYDFTEGTTTNAVDWAESGSADRVSDKSYEDDFSMKFVAPTSAQATTTGSITVSTNTEYILSGWVWNNLDSGTNAYIDLNDIAEECSPSSTQGNNAWEFVSCKFVTAGGTSSVTVRLVVDGASIGSNTGDVWFDQISLHRSQLWDQDGGYDGFGAVELNGIGDRLEVYPDNSIELTNNFTSMLWVKAKDLTGDHQVLLSKWQPSGANNAMWVVELNTGTYTPQFVTKKGADANDVLVSPTDLIKDQWHHVAVSYDGVSKRIYIDGVQTNTSSLTGNLNSNNGILAIGAHNITGDQNWFNGSVDELMMFNRSLSAQQILALYENKTNFIHTNETKVNEIWNASITPNDGGVDGATTFATYGVEVLADPLCYDDDGDGWNITGGVNCGPVDCDDDNTEVRPISSGEVALDQAINDLKTNLIMCNDTYYFNFTSAPGDARAINVNATNLVIDCNGSHLIGNFSGRGMGFTNSQSGIVIRNCVLDNFNFAFSAVGWQMGDHYYIDNAHIKPGNNFSFAGNYADNWTVANSIVEGRAKSGLCLDLYSQTDWNFTRNVLKGIRFNGNMIVDRNNISDFDSDCYCSGANLTNNNFTASMGIYGTNVSVVNNTFWNITDIHQNGGPSYYINNTFTGGSSRIEFNGDNLHVYNNTFDAVEARTNLIQTRGWGAVMWNLDFRGNVLNCSGTDFCMDVFYNNNLGAKNISIVNNTFYEAYNYSILFENASGINNISFNHFVDANSMLYLWNYSGEGFEIKNNTFDNVSDTFIYFEEVNGTNITANNFTGASTGLYMLDSNDSYIYDNIFACTTDVYDNGTNYWNVSQRTGPSIINGQDVGGNNYSNYTGYDHNSDGIGDNPGNYSISGGNNYDYLPLITSWGNTAPTHSVPMLNSTTVNNYTTENLTVYNQSTFDSDGDGVKNIYNWYRNGTSIAVLNMPFEGGSNDTFTKDYSGYGNNATVFSGSWERTSGHDGFGVYGFDNTNDYIDLRQDASLNITENITLLAWIKTNNTADIDDIIAKWDAPSSEKSFKLCTNVVGVEGKVSFRVSSDGTTNSMTVNSTTTVTDDVWHHIAAVYDNVNLEIYVDGVKEQSSAYSSDIFSIATENVYIGAEREGVYPNKFLGYIDDVMILNRSLNANQILELYENKTNFIHSDETKANELWNVTVTPNDGYIDGETLWSNILNVTEGISCTDADGDGFNATGASCGPVDCDDTNVTIRPISNGTTGANQSVNTISSNITICTDTYNFNLTGARTQLYESMSRAINVNASNLVIDCNGSMLIGNGSNMGIMATSDFDNVSILNCNFENFTVGIGGNTTFMASNLFIRNSTFANTINYSLGGSYAHNLTLFESTIDAGASHGISLAQANKFNFTNNTFGSKVLIESSEGSIFKYNLFEGDLETTWDVSNFTLIENNLSDGDVTIASTATILDMNNVYTEITITSAGYVEVKNSTFFAEMTALAIQGDNITILNNTFEGSDASRTSLVKSRGWGGDYVWNGLIKGNWFNGTNTDYAIQLYLGDQTSVNISIVNNTFIAGDEYGVYLGKETGYTNLTNNTFDSCSGGIYIWNSSGDEFRVRDNVFNDLTGIALDFLNSSDVNVTFNDVDNGTIALKIVNSSDFTVTNNTFVDLDTYGLQLIGSLNNLIYDNYFSDFTGVYDNGTNYWNTTEGVGPSIINGGDIGGNYYDDYTGYDYNSDGIGDNPGNYSISGGTMFDYLPLNSTWGNTRPTQSMPILNATTLNNYTDENLTVYNQSTYDVDNGGVKNTYNWYKDGVSIQLLNMPFDINGSSGNTLNVKDYSSYGNNGTYNVNDTNAGPYWNATGGHDGLGAYYFDGIDDYISIPDVDILDFEQENMSVSLWVRSSANLTDTNAGRMFGKGRTGSFIGYDLYYKSSTDKLGWGDVAGGVYKNNVGMDDFNWHHLVVTYQENNSYRMFLDGVELAGVGSGLEDGFNVTDTNFTIGCRLPYNLPSQHFKGAIDEFVLWNVTLTSEQVVALYINQTNKIVSQETQIGEVWQACVTPNDGYVDGVENCSLNITVLNSLPSVVGNISSYSASNYSTSDIYVNWTYSDNESEVELDSETKWTKDGVNPSLNNNSIIDSANLSDGEVWQVSVRVYDGYDWSAWSENASITLVAVPSTSEEETTSSGGGGGGGGISVFDPDYGLLVEPELFNFEMIQHEVIEEELTLTNLMIFEQEVELDVSGLKSFVSFDEYNLTLEKEEIRSLNMYVISGEDTGTFTGMVNVSGNNTGIEVPVVIGVESINVLFDAKIDLPADLEYVKPGDILPAQITVFSVGSPRKVDVVLNYYMKDMNNNILWGAQETVAVEGQYSFSKSFNVPMDLESGLYALALDVVYVNSVATSSTMFTLLNEERALESHPKNKYMIYVLIILVLVIFFVVILIKRGFKNRWER
jgi:hypothetical protein